MSGLVVSGVFVYPVKGFRGIAKGEARVSDRGFEDDRRFLVVDENGEFVTQRTHPVMALVETAIDGDAVVVRAPGLDPLRLAIRDEGREVSVKIWDDTVVALDQGAEAAAFATALLGKRASIVRMPDASIRGVDRKYARPADRVSFADAYPFLVVGDASLDDLNSRLGSPVPMNRFRPSITIAGGAPYAEDEWKAVRIGDVVFHLVKPCARCVVTTVDQTTAAKGVEPLRTLTEYRNATGKVLFGQNAVHDGRGVVRVGDPVHVL